MSPSPTVLDPAPPMLRRRTIARAVEAEGIGVHSGARVRMRLLPAEAGAGISFIRTDLAGARGVAGAPEIPASPASVNRAMLRRMTALGEPPATVMMIEHLLAACAGAGAWDLRVEIDSAECPIFDGSAAFYGSLLREAGFVERGPMPRLRLTEPVALLRDDAELVAIPAGRPCYAFFAEFRHAGMDDQRVVFDPAIDDFETAIAPARTFAFHHEIEALLAAGLAKGGSLECAIVLRDGAPVNGDFRMPDELARHKALDLIGDLAILGAPVDALITARRTGHALHQEFAAMLAERVERA